MTRFSFGTFLVDDSNREACECCRKVAALEPVAPLPLVVVGDEGCGKSHLLYSIVNRVKSSAGRTGLACVTAYDFPDRARALIDDPSPVERAQSAILIVDQLEQFRDLTEEIEGVIRIFLDNHHYVVVATNVHPVRLKNLSESFRELLLGGRLVEIEAQKSAHQVELIKRQAQQESEALVARQRQEIQELRELLEQTGTGEAGAAAGPRAAQAAQVLESERAAKQELARQLKEAKARYEGVQRELSGAQGKIEAARAAMNRDVAAAKHEVEVLQGQLTEARGQAGQAKRDMAALTAEIDELRVSAEALAGVRAAHETAEGRVAELERELAEACREGDAARDEANRLLKRAESLLEQVESNRSQLAQVKEDSGKRVAELEALLQRRTAQMADPAELALAKAEAEEMRTRLDAFQVDADRERDELARCLDESRRELDQVRKELDTQAGRFKEEMDALRSARNALEAQAGELRAEIEVIRTSGDERSTSLNAALDAAQSERDDLRAALEGALSERDDLRAALEGALSERDDLRSAQAKAEARREEAAAACQTLEREMEALRHEAAVQVAEAHAQAGELEGELARQHAARKARREAGRSLLGQLQGLAEQSAAVARAVSDFGRGFAEGEPEEDEPGGANAISGWSKDPSFQDLGQFDLPEQLEPEGEQPRAPFQSLDGT